MEKRFMFIKLSINLKNKTCPGPYCKNISLNNVKPLLKSMNIDKIKDK